MKKIFVIICLLLSFDSAAVKKGYILQTGEKDAGRLNLQNDLIKQASLDHIERAGLSEGQVVVDMGCGSGSMTLYLAEKVGPTGHVYAIDNSQEQLDVTRKAIEGSQYSNIVSYILCDIETPQPEALLEILGNVDLVYMKYVLMHLANPQEALRNIHALLRKGGVVASQESVLSSAHTEPYLSEIRESYGKSIQLGEKLGQDKNIGNKLDVLYGQAGFDIEEFYVVTHRLPMAQASQVLIKSVEGGGDSLIEHNLWTVQEIEAYKGKLKTWGDMNTHSFVFDQRYCIAKKK